ncbi:MAG TPA: M50 family metallopeptidase, partial [bacterium]|nr:M50 family metallopeptidase [bacterium]
GFFLKSIIGILLIWLGAAVVCVLFQTLPHIPWVEKEPAVFMGGFAAYLLIHFLLYKPVFSHVLAHELTHALAAVMMGGKVSSLEASDKGGNTVVNKSHVFICLAPYVFPFYTAVTLLFYLVAAEPHRIYFIALMGFTYAFHVVLTIYSLSHHQPDLQEGGVVFSLIFILTGNLVILLLLVCLICPKILPWSLAFHETAQWVLSLAQSFWIRTKPYLSRLGGRAS